MARFRIMPHGWLQEWVAEEQGYCTAEGLHYTFVSDYSTKVSGAAQHAEPSEVRVVRQGAFESMPASWESFPEEQHAGAHYTSAVLV